MIVSSLKWVLGTELGSSGRTANALYYCVLSPAPVCLFILNFIQTRSSLLKLHKFIVEDPGGIDKLKYFFKYYNTHNSAFVVFSCLCVCV